MFTSKSSCTIETLDTHFIHHKNPFEPMSIKIYFNDTIFFCDLTFNILIQKKDKFLIYFETFKSIN